MSCSPEGGSERWRLECGLSSSRGDEALMGRPRTSHSAWAVWTRVSWMRRLGAVRQGGTVPQNARHAVPKTAASNGDVDLALARERRAEMVNGGRSGLREEGGRLRSTPSRMRASRGLDGHGVFRATWFRRHEGGEPGGPPTEAGERTRRDLLDLLSRGEAGVLWGEGSRMSAASDTPSLSDHCSSSPSSVSPPGVCGIRRVGSVGSGVADGL
jgi:hypothetical protein